MMASPSSSQQRINQFVVAVWLMYVATTLEFMGSHPCFGDISKIHLLESLQSYRVTYNGVTLREFTVTCDVSGDNG